MDIEHCSNEKNIKKSIINYTSQTESNTYLKQKAFRPHNTLNETLCVHYSSEKVKQIIKIHDNRAFKVDILKTTLRGDRAL